MASYKFLPYDAHILQMSMLLAKKNESTSQYFHTNFPSNFIHNRQNLEKKLKILLADKRINKLSHTHTIVTILQ